MNIITTNAAKTGHKIMARKLSRMELNQFTAALAEGAPKTAMGNNNPATATMDIFLYSDSNITFSSRLRTSVIDTKVAIAIGIFGTSRSRASIAYRLQHLHNQSNNRE